MKGTQNKVLIQLIKQSLYLGITMSGKTEKKSFITRTLDEHWNVILARNEKALSNLFKTKSSRTPRKKISWVKTSTKIRSST